MHRKLMYLFSQHTNIQRTVLEKDSRVPSLRGERQIFGIISHCQWWLYLNETVNALKLTPAYLI